MTLLIEGPDRRTVPPAPVDDPQADPVGRGFRDCRGVWHALDRDDDGGRD
ncbi:hypothetical protein QWY28_06425 [Nocardioides sp. SOB77]|uniref:Uncharacterized protein n=1 Tax=Nocardioides oceani TaxID=3058369 RepID=A0ABT8FDB2_9ACTN|nr:hypothetical protein [Nocardioides oceani]MDN4172571.1 hypothetical protein [Nocardioides oceani]